MRQQDILPNYDWVLADLCALIIERQKKDPELFGMVAAAVVDNNGHIVSNTSYNKDNKWVHAERAAINSYKIRHSDVPAGSIIVTTLSPCCKSMSDRYGSNCTDFITDLGIETVYYGYYDPTQQIDHVAFDLIESDNPQIKELCKLFADTFLSD